MARLVSFRDLRGTGMAQAVGFLSSTPSTAWAEVCDKVAGDNWMPADGPIDLSFAAQSLVAVGLLCIVVFFRLTRLSWMLFGLMGLLILLRMSGTESDPITQAAINEGCRRPRHILDIVLPMIAGIAFAWVALRQSLSGAPRVKA